MNHRIELLIPDAGILHYLDDECVIYSINSRLIVKTSSTKKVKSFSWIRLPDLVYRVFRMGVHKVILHHGKLFIIVNQSIQILCFDTLKLIATAKLRGKRPLCIEKYRDGIIYGEYYSNPDRDAIKIIYIDDKGFESCLTELSGVRHIHSITYNDHLNKFLVCTGDLDKESCIYSFSLDFLTHEKLLFGSQQYRVVQPACYRNKVLFGSDIPNSVNSLYEFNLDTREVCKICTVPGPVFYSLAKGPDVFFATVVEPSSINDQRCAHIFHVNEDLYAKNIGTFEKDRISMRLGQYGQIMFPRYDVSSSPKVYYTEFATKNHLGTGSYAFT